MPFKGAANLPVGSQLDTSKGRVALTSAADTGGVKTQTSDFYSRDLPGQADGARRRSPRSRAALITDLVMKGQIARSQCAPLKGARAAAVVGQEEEEGPEGGAREAVGQRQGQVPHRAASTARRRCAARSGSSRIAARGRFTKVSARDGPACATCRRKKTVTVEGRATRYLARAAARRRRRRNERSSVSPSDSTDRGQDERIGRVGAPGERRGRWLAVRGRVRDGAARCRPRPRARPTPRSTASPLNIYANDNGQLQVAFDGSAHRRVLSRRPRAPAYAGLNIGPAPISAPRAPFVGLRLPAARSFTPATRSRRSAATAAPAIRGCSRPATARGQRPARIPSVHVDRATHLRQRVRRTSPLDLRRLETTATRPTLQRPRLPSPPTSTSPATTPASGFFDPGPPRQVGGINPGAAAARARLVEVDASGRHYQEARLHDPATSIRNSTSERRRASPTPSTRRSSTTAPASQWDFASLWSLGAQPDGHGRLALPRASTPSTLVAASATQTVGPDRDGHRHGAQQRRQPRCRAAPSATRSPARTPAAAR